MSDLRIAFEWEDPGGVRGPELAATWARLELRAGDVVLTEIEDIQRKTIRTGIYVPLYPFAEWVASNWWWLWYEQRATQLRAHHSPRHGVLAAREGFPLPALSLWPLDTQILVLCTATTHEPSLIRFLNSVEFVADKEQVRDEVSRLVDSVVERLGTFGIEATYLQEEWALIRRVEAVEPERLFCEHAARLGLDPFAIDATLSTAIEEILLRLPLSVQRDFSDAANPLELGGQASALTDFLRDAADEPASNLWKAMPVPKTVSWGVLPPWQQGYEHARFLRRELNINGSRLSTIDDILNGLGMKRESVPIKPWHPDPIDAVVGLGQSHGPVFGLSGNRPESRAFSFCRAFGEFLLLDEPQPLILTRESASLRQKRSRAFAAEFLAPAEKIRERLTRSVVTDEDCDSVAADFGVSAWVVKRQIVNHQLAEYAGESF